MTCTYIDANVVIAAARGDDALASRALTYLEDPQRTFVPSIFVRLEVLPKAAYLKRSDEAACYTTFLDSVRAWAPVSNALLEHAHHLAVTHGLSAPDAIHVAAAIALQADELITAERPEKPMHRVIGVRVASLFPPGT